MAAAVGHCALQEFISAIMVGLGFGTPAQEARQAISVNAHLSLQDVDVGAAAAVTVAGPLPDDWACAIATRAERRTAVTFISAGLFFVWAA